MKAGETLLVHGAAGGTGAAAIQLGKALGGRVIAVASGALKTQKCLGFGADEVVDSSREDFVERVHVLTGGAHEPRTVVAMTLRSAFWVAQALLLPRIGSLSAPK